MYISVLILYIPTPYCMEVEPQTSTDLAITALPVPPLFSLLYRIVLRGSWRLEPLYSYAVELYPVVPLIQLTVQY